jgi:peptidoglycan/xylan/chitin deacetylase (PgdA/CDA1 family)
MTDGRLVVVFDDGYAEDNDLLCPVLERLEVPAVLAVVPTWLGDEDHLTVAQLRELADAGWEVAAHGRGHRYCQAHPLAADAGAGDDRLALGGGHVFPDGDGGVLVGDELEATDGETTERVEVAATTPVDGSDGGQAHVELATALDGAFDAADTVVRPTMDLLGDELLGGREALREMGFDPSTLVFPYDAASVRAWRLAREAFDVVADAAVRSLPNPPGTPLTNLRRWYLETSHHRPAETADYLDAVAEQGGLGVLAGHSARETVTAERVQQVVEMARERGVEMTTFESLDGS